MADALMNDEKGLDQPAKESHRHRPAYSIEDDLKAMFKKLPAGEEDWSVTQLQSDEDVARLFGKLTLMAHANRCQISCVTLLKSLARNVDQNCHLEHATLLAACIVATKQGHLINLDFKSIMGDNGLVLDSNKVLRRGIVRYIQIADAVHRLQPLGLRTYEFALVRSRYEIYEWVQSLIYIDIYRELPQNFCSFH